jgi:hypothetical protein
MSRAKGRGPNFQDIFDFRSDGSGVSTKNSHFYNVTTRTVADPVRLATAEGPEIGWVATHMRHAAKPP